MNEDATKKPISPSISLAQKACPRTRSSEKRGELGMLGESNLHVAEGMHSMKETRENSQSQTGPTLEGLGNQDGKFKCNERQGTV